MLPSRWKGDRRPRTSLTTSWQLLNVLNSFSTQTLTTVMYVFCFVFFFFGNNPEQFQRHQSWLRGFISIYWQEVPSLWFTALPSRMWMCLCAAVPCSLFIHLSLQLAGQVGCQLMAPLSERLCVLPGDMFSSPQKLVIYHYSRQPWEWFRQTAPTYCLGAQS